MFPHTMYEMYLLVNYQTISLFDLLVVILFFFVPPAIMAFAMTEAEHRYQSLKG